MSILSKFVLSPESKSDDSSIVEIRYASITSRLMASLIDCFILMIIIYPVGIILSNYMLPELKNLPPPNMEAMQETIDAFKSKQISMSELIADTPAMQVIMNPVIAKKVILLQLLQLIFVSLLILLCWRFRGNTPGKYIVGINIVDADTLNTPSNKQFLLRLLGYFIDIIPGFGIGLLWALFNKKHQAWHDKIANTIVIRQKANLWKALTERRK